MKKLQLYFPVKPLFYNQKFGEISNIQYYKDHGLALVGHNGIDFACSHGQPIYASHDGIAYFEIDGSQGYGVVLKTNEEYEYNGSTAYFKTIYWHLCDSRKEPQFKSPVEGYTGYNNGLKVKAGDLIGYADSTGLSTGDHLHYGLKPMSGGESDNTYLNLENGNGYYGAIDPEPYFNGLFAQDINQDKITFPTNLRMFQSGSEVVKLQKALRTLGYFTYPTNTGFYGTLTREAVLNFQLEAGVVKFGIESLFGHFFGPLSRKTLTLLINNK